MTRRPLPNRRPSATIATAWEGHPLAVTIGVYPDTGAPGEVFCDTERGGTLQASIADACVLISIALQHGIAPADMAKSLGRVPAFVNGEQVDAPTSPVGAVMAAVLGGAGMRPKFRILDLFSGIGGFSLGLERTGGFETVAFCEIEPFPRRVLAKHWPEVPCYDDVATADFGLVGPVDLVTAGFPCQDISFAGKGAGLAGTRSGLFWHILRTAGLVGRPKLLLENVAALLDRGMGAVLGALASFGYDAEWHCIPASYVGARQLRDRVWIVADPQRDGVQRGADIAAAWKEKSREEQLAGLVQPCAWPEVSSAGSCGTGHGIPNGTHRNRAIGNAVVPQIPELIGRAILAATFRPQFQDAAE